MTIDTLEDHIAKQLQPVIAKAEAHGMAQQSLYSSPETLRLTATELRLAQDTFLAWITPFMRDHR